MSSEFKSIQARRRRIWVGLEGSLELPLIAPLSLNRFQGVPGMMTHNGHGSHDDFLLAAPPLT